MSVNHKQRVLYKELCGPEMRRLVRALDSPLDAEYAKHVESRVKFITGKFKLLPDELHNTIIQTMKEHLETGCKDEALRSRLLESLGGRQAA